MVRWLVAAAVVLVPVAVHQDVALKDLMPKGMVIGVAINQRQFDGTDTAAVEIITRQFNQISPENLLKFQLVHPAAVLQTEERPAVTGRQACLAQHRLDLVGEVEEAERVRHRGAAPAEVLGELGLGCAELVDQPPVPGGLLDGVQVLALEVLDQRDLEEIPLVHFADDHGHRREAGLLGRKSGRGFYDYTRR